MPPEQVNAPAPLQPETAKPVPFWKRKIVWIPVLAIIIFVGWGQYLLVQESKTGVSSGSDNSGPTRDVFAANCGAFSLVLHEQLRINRFEGSGESFSLIYKTADKTETLFNEPETFRADYPVIPPLHTKVPNMLFENLIPENIKDRVHLRTVFVSPQRFSKADFDNIGNCLKENLNNFDTARKNHLERYDLPRGTFRFVAVAYVDQKDFENFVDTLNTQPFFDEGRGENNGGTYVQNDGAVTSVSRGYLGSVFDLIPAESTSSLKYETLKNQSGESLGQYLQVLASNLANYDGQPR